MSKNVALFAFPKSNRLRKRHEYQRVGRQGKRLYGTFLAVEVRNRAGSTLKLGLTVSKKFGPAVKRNRFKRLVKEAFRLSWPTLPRGLEINVRPKGDAESATFLQIRDELIQLIQRASPAPS